ncbi:hypothetical protein V8F06_001567 [Rhypophila decipiens]
MLSPISCFLLLLGLTAFSQADTLNVNIFSQSQGGCAGGPNLQTPEQTFTIGNIGPCHNTTDPFLTVTTSHVAQSFFGRDLRVLSYRNANCVGNPVMQNQLSNTNINCCDSTLVGLCNCGVFGLCDGRLMQSFKIDVKVLG